MNVEIFKKNVLWNISQIAVQFQHAEQVNGKAKSGYYKAAIMIASSVVEALAYKLLKENEKQNMPLDDWKSFRYYQLPQQYKSINGKFLSICERTQFPFELTKHTDFKKVNEICYKLKLFSSFFSEK